MHAVQGVHLAQVFFCEVAYSLVPFSMEQQSPLLHPAAEALLGVVLSGGRCRRFGSDKSSLVLFPSCPKTLLQRSVDVLRLFCAEVLVSGKQVGYAPYLPDNPPGRGPIGGIAAALQYAQGRACVVLSCDVPFVGARHIEALLDFRKGRPPATCRTAYQSESTYIESMVAVYEPEALPCIEERMAASAYALRFAVPKERQHLLVYPQSDNEVFMNINTPHDVKRARALIAAGVFEV